MNSFQKFWNHFEVRKKQIIFGVLTLIYTIGIYFLLELGLIGVICTIILIFITYLIVIRNNFKKNQRILAIKKKDENFERRQKEISKLISRQICDYKLNSDENLIYSKECMIFYPKCETHLESITISHDDLHRKIIKYGIIISIYQSIFLLFLTQWNGGIISFLIVTLGSFFGISYLIYKKKFQ